MSDYQIAAYATAFRPDGWDRSWEAEYLDRLAGVDRLAIMEIPWLGQLHLADEPWFLSRLQASKRRWRLVVTSIVDVGMRRAEDPRFGIASTEESARRAAVDRILSLRRSISSANAALGYRAVEAIHLFSAPGAGGEAGPDPLRRSLDELLALDWEGAELLLEHADALIPEHHPEKGFLALADELEVVRGYDASEIRMALNWGRSVIELRDPDRFVEHVRSVVEAGLLANLSFSGVALVDTVWGPAWSDLHPPFADPVDARYAAPDSLMTRANAADAFRAAGAVDRIGIKVMSDPAFPDPAQRVELIATTVETIELARSAASV